MCNFYIYGKIPTERKDFKIKTIDIKNKQIKESTISQILKNNKIKNQDIKEIKIFVSNNPVHLSELDINLDVQNINDNEIIKLYDTLNNEYEYFDDGDILIKNNIYTHSTINDIIASEYKYFVICIVYTDSRKIKLKKINDKIVGDEII